MGGLVLCWGCGFMRRCGAYAAASGCTMHSTSNCFGIVKEAELGPLDMAVCLCADT